MAWQYHPVLVVFALGGLVSLVVAGYCWRYTRTHGRSYLVASIGLLGFNNAIWVFAATLKTASTDLQLSVLFYKLEFLGLLPNTAVALVMALAFVGNDRWLTRRAVVVLGAVPTAFLLLILANPANVMIVDPKLIPAHGILAFEHEFPPLFDVYFAWVYGAVLAAILIIGWGMQTDRIPSEPALAGIVALAAPLMTAVLKTAGIYPPGGDGINITPAASAIGISVLAFVVIRYRVFELVPVGRDHAIEVMADGYLLVGAHGRILDANPAARELLVGDPTVELRGRAIAEVAPVADSIEESRRFDIEIGERVVEGRRSAVRRQQQDAGYVLLLQDVTESRQQQRRLERTNERLDQFASVVSHDLRNPLNVAQGNIEVVRADEDRSELATVSNALARMETLIDDVLTLSREGGRVTDPRRVSLGAVAEDCWEVIDGHDATLTVESDLVLRADADRLQQLLENLVRNAIDHGGDGVEIRVGALPNGEGFYVADDGPGIPAEERDTVFESGYSSDASGTGFGLAIVTEIAESHGWRIEVTDSADGGARFEVSGVDHEE